MYTENRYRFSLKGKKLFYICKNLGVGWKYLNICKYLSLSPDSLMTQIIDISMRMCGLFICNNKP